MGPFVIAFHSPAGPAGDVSPMFSLLFLIPTGPRPRRPPCQPEQTQLMPDAMPHGGHDWMCDCSTALPGWCLSSAVCNKYTKRIANTQISRSTARNHQAAHKYICIGTDIHNHSLSRESHVSVYRISSDCMDDLQTIIPIIINGKRIHECYN